VTDVAARSARVAEGLSHRENDALRLLASDPGHLIRVGRQLHSGFQSIGSKGDLTSSQFAVLLALSRVPGLDQTAVADVSALDRSTVGEIVRRLTKLGFISSVPDSSDARRQRLFASSNAVELVRDHGRRLRHADEIFLSPLNGTEQTWFLTQLRLIAFSHRPDASVTGLEEVQEWSDGLAIAATNWAFGRLIRISQQAYGSLWKREIGSVVTPVAYSAVRVLVEDGPFDQRSLSVILSLDKASMAGLVSRMGSQRLLESALHPSDRRRKIIRVTPKGADSARLIAPSFFRVTESILEPVEQHNRIPFLSLFRRLTVERPDT